jgi:hypothetical protein
MQPKQQILAALCVMGTVTTMLPFPAKASLAPDTGVFLYTGENYSGTPLIFSPGATYNVTLEPEYRNQISSLKVPKGFKVILIDSESSMSRTFKAGNHQFVGKKMNNQADIVIVARD